MTEIQSLILETKKKTVRFIDREGYDGRSKGSINIRRVGENIKKLYKEDWFHSFASLSTKTVIFTILLAYFVSIFFWAFMFYTFRNYGFIDIHNYLNALVISLETIATVGYTVTDVSFNDQPLAFILLFCEMMQSILMNSFCIGIVYARLSRAFTRARSIIFSRRAVIRQINGEWYFMFQVCERRKHQLIESHISCYSVQKTVSASAGIPYQLRSMRLDHPDDRLGGYILLFLPAVIIHHIDKDSPLYPSSTLQSDTETPILTESSIRNHIEGNDIEIMVLIEGTESVTSNSLQARYSYVASDIEYNMTFAPCVYISDKNQAVINFNNFQELVPIDPNSNLSTDLFIQTII